MGTAIIVFCLIDLLGRHKLLEDSAGIQSSLFKYFHPFANIVLCPSYSSGWIIVNTLNEIQEKVRRIRYSNVKHNDHLVKKGAVNDGM